LHRLAVAAPAWLQAPLPPASASYPQFLLWRLLGYAENLQIPIAAPRATR
jgi:hypothetical protein